MTAKTTRARGAQSFYESALDEAERQSMPEALEVEGFAQEIALLRLRLRDILADHPEDLELMLRGMELLRRMVVSRYGLKGKEKKQFETAFAQETARRLEEGGA